MEDFRLEIVELLERNAFLEREGALPANIMQMRMIQQEQEDLKKRMVLREKELRTQRTKREYDKYYISEETGCLYFNKPIDLERFSISSLML